MHYWKLVCQKAIFSQNIDYLLFLADSRYSSTYKYERKYESLQNMLIANEIQGNTLNVMSHNAEQNIKMQEIDWRFFYQRLSN